MLSSTISCPLSETPQERPMVRALAKMDGAKEIPLNGFCYAEVFPGEMSQIFRETFGDCDPLVGRIALQSRVRNSKLGE